MDKSYLWKARIFIYDANGEFHKMVTYHNIDTRYKNWQDKLEEHCKKEFAGLHHINYYGGVPAEFKFQSKFYAGKEFNF